MPSRHRRRAAWISFALLMLALVTIVGLAKVLSPSIEHAVEAAGAPRAVVGIVVAMLVLLPEAWAAARAAHADRLQSSMNLAIGSALACIGLTIPVVALAAIIYDLPLVLGLGAKDLVLLAVTFLVSAFTLGTGRTTHDAGCGAPRDVRRVRVSRVRSLIASLYGYACGLHVFAVSDALLRRDPNGL